MIRSKIASRFKRVKKMLFLWALLALVLHVLPGAVGPVHAQGSRKDDIVFNSRGIPLAGATVRVCAMPATGQPCTPLALIYSDSALTQALANPATTDGLGNYSFYAAPGKYEIEISGPGITTKQLPNVILPNDPSSPNFSGAVSAFSLNLSGNLSVTGNTTVIGNQASGTLSLTNQSTPPGTASASTVNVYTKTADKRLYYKDDTGTEVGPLGNTGATLVSPVTNPTPLYFDTDLGFKGSNPWNDVRRYGKFGTYSSTTANTTSGSASVTLTSAQSFATGEYVTVYNAGAAQTLTTPVAPIVTPSSNAGGLNTVTAGTGTTSFNYKIIAADKFGGYTAASPATTITNGNALGIQTINITSMSRSNNTVTVVTSAAHPFVVGSMVYIKYIFSGGTNTDVTFNGFYMVTAVADSTHFTFNQGMDTRAGAAASDTGGIAIGFNCNALTWTAVTGAWKYYVYGRSGATYSLLGVTMFNSWVDYGSPMNDSMSFPPFIPTTAPSVGANDHLTAKISSGGGTTTLTLATAAGATLTGATIVSDDGPALLAAVSASGFPTYISTAGMTVNSFTAIPGNAKLLVAGQVTLNDTLQFASYNIVEGTLNAGAPAFGYQGFASFSGSYAYPMFNFVNGNTTLKGIYLNCTASNGCLDASDIGGGSGASNLWFENCGFSTGNGNTTDYLGMHAIFQGGGFSFRFDKMLFSTGSPGTNAASNVGFSPIPTVVFKNLNGQVATPTGNFTVSRSWFLLRSSFDQDFVSSSNGINWAIFDDIQTQNSFIPVLMMTGGTNPPTGNIWMSKITPADFPTAVFATLMTGGTQQQNGWFNQISGLAGNSPPITGNPFSNLTLSDVGLNAGQNNNAMISGISTGATTPPASFPGLYVNTNVGGTIGYQMATPAAATAAVSAGGSVPAGSVAYKITAVDTNGNESAVSLPVTVTTTTGNQTVTVTPPTLPSSAVGWKPYRTTGVGNGYALANIPVGCGGSSIAPGTNYVDSFSFTCGNSIPGATASSSSISSNGVSTQQLKLINGGVAESFASSPRAEQNVFLPGALTSTWTGSTWTIDKAVTITRVQVQAKTAPAGCTTSAVVRLTDGTTPVNVTISAAANDSGAISQNYAAGAALQILMQTAAAGCTTSPADANVVVQYRMQ